MTGASSPIATRAAVRFRSSAPQLPHSSRKTTKLQKIDFVGTPQTPPSGKAKTKADKVKPVTIQQKATFLFFPTLSSSLRTLSVVLLLVAVALQFFHKPFIDLLPHSVPKPKPTPTRLVPHEIFGSESTSAAISAPRTAPDNYIEGFAICGQRKRYYNGPNPNLDSPPRKTTEVRELRIGAADTNKMGSNMTLVDKAKAIAEEFEYTPQQVRNGVKEYLQLMGKTF